MTDQPVEPAAPRHPAAPSPTPRPRRKQTVGDMVRSLLVVLALVAVLIGFNAVQQPDPVLRDIEYPAVLEAAQPGVAYDLAGPDPMPVGWRVTSARTGHDRDAVTWHLGMVTAREAYAAVEQTDGSSARLLRRVAAQARASGEVVIEGVTWQRRVGGEPEPRALVRAVGGVTTVVAGTASWAELRMLAAALG